MESDLDSDLHVAITRSIVAHKRGPEGIYLHDYSVSCQPLSAAYARLRGDGCPRDLFEMFGRFDKAHLKFSFSTCGKIEMHPSKHGRLSGQRFPFESNYESKSRQWAK
ncbi:hypothetical protein EVAR_47188_1 [Eumeta japonica]|uniref:Uncharacterized protein n=1 Tax=Eumeta variegata TaxID=151549 RepID=A0A4C1WXD4_EUMVA|nr:hypothetical protein EVAR_47188_1 [Eumeta japonica]